MLFLRQTKNKEMIFVSIHFSYRIYYLIRYCSKSSISVCSSSSSSSSSSLYYNNYYKLSKIRLISCELFNPSFFLIRKETNIINKESNNFLDKVWVVVL